MVCCKVITLRSLCFNPEAWCVCRAKNEHAVRLPVNFSKLLSGTNKRKYTFNHLVFCSSALSSGETWQCRTSGTCHQHLDKQLVFQRMRIFGQSCLSCSKQIVQHAYKLISRTSRCFPLGVFPFRLTLWFFKQVWTQCPNTISNLWTNQLCTFAWL